eukprot:TRINITY_DN178_c3_g2_i5.p1 TRINITY_DN178_c3_g2~~TRINITY_DN178_c3_g2_i5.p1  ORF type:complete len:108 (+),score=17.57 TRINITY_DN178_c3_g2_i5:227-550(+)
MILFFCGVKLAGMLKSPAIICCGCVGIVNESFATIETYSIDGRYTAVNRNWMFRETSQNSPEENNPSGKFTVVIFRILEVFQKMTVPLEWDENFEQVYDQLGPRANY